METVTFFDVEYANSKNKSICQIGLLCEDYNTREPVYPELDVYIDPEDGFDDVCSRIHGITKTTVTGKDTFPIVWHNISHYFTNSVIIGHNVAVADLDALTKALRRYNIDIPELYYVCTLELARAYVPRYAVPDYSMSTLCRYFDIDIDSEHNAFDDACANSDLLKVLVDTYNIDIDSCVRKYSPHESADFTQYIASPVVRKAVNEFYGIVRGFTIDKQITEAEIDFIKVWRDKYQCYCHMQVIAPIIQTINNILEDNLVTLDELTELQSVLESYLDIVSSSPITLATQVLNGIMKGIILDGQVSEDECTNLRIWLYDNIHLSGHYPFDRITHLIESVLEDGVVTKDESNNIITVIHDLLDPVESMKQQVNQIDGKHICLSGNFQYGKKADVEEFLTERGGLIDSSVNKHTDILLIGACECQAYSNGTYGTKVKKAIAYNNNGCNIQIVKESDFFSTVR